MTTISHRRRRGRGGLWLFLVVVLCFIVVGIAFVWREPLTGLFWTVAEPLFSIGKASEENEVVRLQSQLDAVAAALADRNFLYKENLELKSRLGRAPEGKTLLAAVLLRPPSTPYDTFMLDVGEKDGVAVGDLVFAGGSVIIGKITEVYRSTSRATLFSAPGQTHEALIFAEGGSVPVSLEGQGAASFIGKIPQGTPVAEGETVLFPSISPVFAARVSYVEAPQGESFQTVYMQLPINPFTLRFVEVRKPEL